MGSSALTAHTEMGLTLAILVGTLVTRQGGALSPRGAPATST